MGTITDIANQYPWLTGIVLATGAAIMVFIISALIRPRQSQPWSARPCQPAH